MPFVICHDLFGRDILQSRPDIIDLKNDGQVDAFLLGCQGPDPFFYISIDPARGSISKAGSFMHKQKTPQLLLACKEALELFNEDDKPIARAFIAGMLAHYCLDSFAHQFIYFLEREIIQAGEPGLEESDRDLVHAEIEREQDQFMLYRKLGVTVGQFHFPGKVLKASRKVLRICSLAMEYMIISTYRFPVLRDDFSKGVKAYRVFNRITSSPSGLKREAAGKMEEFFIRKFSFIKAYTHRPVPSQDSPFANEGHGIWTDSYGKERNDSYVQIYDAALAHYTDSVDCFLGEGFSLDDADRICKGVNFDGELLP